MSEGGPSSPRSSYKRIGSRQRVSMIESEANPFLSGGAGGGEAATTVRVENLADAKPITDSENASLVGLLNTIEDNAGLLRMLEFQKQPYLFTSLQLLEILKSTTSVKTRLAIIHSIGPRLLDPRAKTDELMGLFRYAEEKARVEEVLKNRSNAINSNMFKQVGGTSNVGGGGGGRGAIGGRGMMGGGRGMGGAAGRGAPSTGRGPGSAASPAGGRGLGGATTITPQKLQLSAADESALSLDAVVEGGESDDDDSDEEAPASQPALQLTDEPTAPNTAIPNPESIDGTKKRRTSLVINKRPVTVKTTADIAQGKLDAAQAKEAESTPAKPTSAVKGVPGARATPSANSSSTPSVTPLKGVTASAQKPVVGGNTGPTTPAPSTPLSARTPSTAPPPTSTSRAKTNLTVSTSSGELSRENGGDVNDQINREIDAVMKILNMDSTGAQEASRELEIWEMLVVTNKTMESALAAAAGESAPAVTPSNAGRELLVKKKSTSAPPMSPTVQEKMQKRNSFRFLTGVFSSASSAYVAAATKSATTTPVTTPATTPVAATGAKTSVSTWLFESFGSKTLGDNMDVLDGKAPGAPSHDVLKVSDLAKAFNPTADTTNVPNPILSPEDALILDIRISTDPAGTEDASSLRADPTSRFAAMSASAGRAGSIHNASPLYLDAARPSFALGVDPQTFLSLKAERELTTNAEGIPQFTYQELVRRNFNKDYRGLNETDLEQYLNDTEFAVKFGMDKESFAKLPQWKRISLKKALSLF